MRKPLTIAISLALLAALATPAHAQLKGQKWLKKHDARGLGGRVEVDCEIVRKERRLMVVLVAGQSNAANFGLVPRESGFNVFSFANGRCFKAVDPLAGASGDGGSIWTRFGDLVLKEGLADAVLIVPIAIGATKVSDWKRGGKVHHWLVEGLRGPLSAGFRFTHIFWMQGEHDAIEGTSRGDYYNDLASIVDAMRSGGIKAPMFVSLTSLCGSHSSEEVRFAQRRLARERDDVLPGPDTDEIGRKFRYDGCHFNEEGLEEAAHAWIEAIKARGAGDR